MITRMFGSLMAVAVLAGVAVAPPAAAAGAKPKLVAVPTTPPPAKSTIGIDTQAKHALIVEVETGEVLLDKAAEERMPPASMSKIMTAYVVFDMLKKGQAKLDDELPVSEKAWRPAARRCSCRSAAASRSRICSRA